MHLSFNSSCPQQRPLQWEHNSGVFVISTNGPVLQGPPFENNVAARKSCQIEGADGSHSSRIASLPSDVRSHADPAFYVLRDRRTTDRIHPSNRQRYHPANLQTTDVVIYRLQLMLSSNQRPLPLAV